jgi:hypothetical protein
MYEKIKTFVASCNGLQAVKPAYAYINPFKFSQQFTDSCIRWSAVVRGAAVKGLEGAKKNMIKTRKCRRHYGTDYCARFSARRHKEADSYVDSYDGIKSVRNQMRWLLTLGQDVSTSKDAHAETGFMTDFLANRGRCVFSEALRFG